MHGKEIQYLQNSDQLNLRSRKEAKLRQHAKVIWMCGLSGAGKSTIAFKLERQLFDLGYIAHVLDGDYLRSGLNKDLGFSDEDRIENLRRVAELSKLIISGGIITINAFISPTSEIRNQARSIIGHQDFIEVFVNAPIQICEQRDKKGLYEKARMGLIKDFTGIDSPFEEPANPDIEVRTDKLDVQESVNKLIKFLLPHIEYKN
ncbi:MAG TPA: adenylyl-sulfate kinase [Bacteroidales bacterium]|nr:adenylyl-sulfate kinase [Bacteroidales bacterium]